MYRSFIDLRARKELLEQYRVFRRGIITLPYLERDLERDLERLGRYIEVHSPSTLQKGFIEVAILAIETTNDVIASTVVAVEHLMDYVATSGRVMDREKHSKFVSENILDDEAKHLILNTLRLHGGLEGFLGTSHDILVTKRYAYSRATRLSKQRFEESWKQAQIILDNHYKGELETLVGYWRRLLKEEEEAAGGKPYFSQIAYDLCIRYPDMAMKLGIKCPDMIPWPIILIAVACAILCEGD